MDVVSKQLSFSPPHQVTSLRQSVMEREKQIIDLNERHAKDVASLREAQGQAQRSATHLTSTVDHVLKVLAIPYPLYYYYQ